MLRYTVDRGTERVFRDVPLAAFACSERPLRALREIRPEEPVRVHHEERPAWTPGRVYKVSLKLSKVRPESDYCGPANVVVIEETPPAGWKPLGVPPCSEITEEGTIKWTLRRGECGSASFPDVLEYEVEAGGKLDLAVFSGSIEEPGSPTRFQIEGVQQLYARADFSSKGFVRRWLLLGPFAVDREDCASV